MEENRKELIRDAEALLREFEDPETKLQENPLFARVYMTLCNGGSPYTIIEQLVGMVDDYKEQLKELVTNGMPPIKVELNEDNIDLIFKETFFSGGEFPDW